jgi:uncharacterized OB-fold protein
MTGLPATGERMTDWTTGVARIVVSTCDNCGNVWYLPHERCPACWATESRSAAAAGTGLCVAVTQVHVTLDGGGPVGLALAELDEGVLVLGRAGGPLRAGDRVTVHFEQSGDTELAPTFRRSA